MCGSKRSYSKVGPSKKRVFCLPLKGKRTTTRVYLVKTLKQTKKVSAGRRKPQDRRVSSLDGRGKWTPKRCQGSAVALESEGPYCRGQTQLLREESNQHQQKKKKEPVAKWTHPQGTGTSVEINIRFIRELLRGGRSIPHPCDHVEHIRQVASVRRIGLCLGHLQFMALVKIPPCVHLSWSERIRKIAVFFGKEFLYLEKRLTV